MRNRPTNNETEPAEDCNVENISMIINLLNKVHIQPEIAEMFGKDHRCARVLFCQVYFLFLSLFSKQVNKQCKN